MMPQLDGAAARSRKRKPNRLENISRIEPVVLDAFSELFRKNRIEYGYRQEDVAADLDVGTFTVQRWETGKRGPSLSDLVKIVRYFDIDWRSLGEMLENAVKAKDGSR